METQVQIEEMPLIGGTLVFDFLNTCGGSLDACDDETLHDYRDLVAWGRHAGALTAAEADRLVLRARERGTEARAIHTRAIAQRRYLAELFSALMEGRRAPATCLTSLRADEAEAVSHAELVETEAGFDWSWADADGLTRPLWPIIHAATTLLISGQMWRAKRCPGCGWWFIDESRNQSRRWCRMEDCGTAEKMRRYVSRRAARRAAGQTVEPLTED